MEVEHGGGLADHRWRLFNEISTQPDAIRGGDDDIFKRQSQRAGSLDKHTGTVRLFWVIDEGVLVMIECPYNYHHQEDEDDGTPIHPVDENQQQDGRTTDSPELPQKKHKESAESLRGTKSHVAIGGQHR